MHGIEGKVMLVTGGGRGLGAAISEDLAEGGARVVVADLRRDAAGRVASGLVERGFEASSLALDVTDPAQVEDAVRRTLDEFGRIDVLVNNAGVDLTVPVEEMPIAEWQRIIATNLTAPFLMARQVLGSMREHGRGHIVNVVSTAAKRAWANASAYHASKWGLLGFSHALHVEARSANVKVSAVVCGGMRTPFLTERFPDIDLATLQDPRNVARTIRFLLTQPAETVIPEIMVLPMRESSWP